MPDELPINSLPKVEAGLPAGPPSSLMKLKPRKSPKDYWDGYRAGLKAARDGIDRSLAHFEELIAATADEDNGKN